MAKPAVATLKHIAERAGVSSVAVGSVLLGSGNGRVRVAPKTAARIRKIAADMNYRPNPIARQLRGKSSHIIGVLIDSHTPEAHHDLLAKLERRAYQNGYRFMVGQSHGEVSVMRSLTEDFRLRGTDGLICMAHDYPENGATIADMLRDMENLVFIDEPALLDENTHYVAKDIAAGMQDATNYLIKQGRRRIAFLQFAGWRVMEQRYWGYRQGLKENGILFDEALVRDISFDMGPDGFTVELLAPVVDELVSKHRVDAILACNDYVAAMVIKVLHLSHHQIPEDVAVVGFDNLKLSQVLHPSLTTLNPHNEVIASKSIEMLLRLIKGEVLRSEERRVSVRPSLVIREST